MGGIGFDDAWTDRAEAVLVTDGGELPLPCIGLDDLIESRRAAGRPHDLTDPSFLTRRRRMSPRSPCVCHAAPARAS